MARAKNQGECFICHQTYSKASMSRHVQVCLQKHLTPEKKGKQDEILLIELVAYKQFWMYIEISGKATLSDLDDFLRRVWLECCGHLSEFKIGHVRYLSNTEHSWDNEESMDVPIGDILSEGSEFTHSYDFGTSTDLTGRVIAIREGVIKKRIQLLARNHLPELHCSCKKQATELCSICLAVVCENCREDHECGDLDMMLPLVNSPRAGQCGYEGSNEKMSKYSPEL